VGLCVRAVVLSRSWVVAGGGPSQVTWHEMPVAPLCAVGGCHDFVVRVLLTHYLGFTHTLFGICSHIIRVLFYYSVCSIARVLLARYLGFTHPHSNGVSQVTWYEMPVVAPLCAVGGGHGFVCGFCSHTFFWDLLTLLSGVVLLLSKPLACSGENTIQPKGRLLREAGVISIEAGLSKHQGFVGRTILPFPALLCHSTGSLAVRPASAAGDAGECGHAEAGAAGGGEVPIPTQAVAVTQALRAPGG